VSDNILNDEKYVSQYNEYLKKSQDNDIISINPPNKIYEPYKSIILNENGNAIDEFFIHENNNSGG